MSVEGLRAYLHPSSREVMFPDSLRDEIKATQEKRSCSPVYALAYIFIAEGVNGLSTGQDVSTHTGAIALGRTIIGLEDMVIDGFFDYKSFISDLIFYSKGVIHGLDSGLPNTPEEISLSQIREMRVEAANEKSFYSFLQNDESLKRLLPKRLYSLLQTSIQIDVDSCNISTSIMNIMQAQLPLFKSLAEIVVGEPQEDPRMAEWASLMENKPAYPDYSVLTKKR